MAKLSLNELYKKYSNTYDKLEVKYGVSGRVGKLSFTEFQDGFKDYANGLRQKRYVTNARAAELLAEDSVFTYSREGAEQIQKYGKEVLGKEYKYADLRLGKGTAEALVELRTAYEEGKIDGLLHDSSEWKLWSSSYIFGSN